MAVNLSPIWGAGAQLLDNSGNVLSGGKIYTYAAGTTTQVATYTSNNGITANSNPIILNSAGRVPYEIWLTDGQNYKFVLKDSNDVLIGTWDNLSGINSNFVAYTNQQEIQTATAGQTVFNLTTMQYLPGTGNLSVFVDGVNQYGPGAQYAFEETDQTTVTFASGLHVGASVKFTSTQIQNAGVTDASQISYTYPDSNAVSQSVENRLAEFVLTSDFGAVGDGVTDDTAAVQAAVDYCIGNNKNLLVSGMCLLTDSINIDRQVDGAAYDNYFIISSENGGGFVVDTAIAMFSSTIPFTTAPVSQLVKFDNLIFSSTDNSLAAYVLDEARFLRTRFDGCSFQKIKMLVASTYTQSIYMTDCNVRRFTGIFFDSQAYTYDFKMVNCLVEAGVNCLHLNNPVGCSVVSSCIEGMSGTAIAYDGAQGLDVTGSYFEANGLDIDGTDGGTSTSNSYGVCLNGNYFSNSTSTYTVKWYNIYGGVSIGNWHTNNMHDLTGTINNLITYDIAQGSLSASSTIQTIQGGYSGTFVGTLTGCTTSPTATLRFNRVGNDVTLFVPGLTGTSNSSGCSITGLPSYLIPARQQIVVGRVLNNSAEAFGIYIVNSGTGVITLGSDASGAGFITSGTKGSLVTTITYSVN